MELEQFFYSLLNILNEMSPFVLLGFLIAGVLHVFVKPELMSRHLSGPGFGPVVKAALFGIPLPLCSCGVLPTAVSLRRQGASRGATTSFLIATPQTGVDSIAATYSLLGLPMAVLRPMAALAGAVCGGWTVSRACAEEETAGEGASVPVSHAECCTEARRPASFPSRIVEAVRYGLVDMVASVGKWLVIGLIVAAIITVTVPDSYFLALNRYPLLGMLAVLLVAIPMYICATGSIPIALSLMMKGLSPGIAFVLLMAGPAANFASIIVLSRTQGRKATLLYVGSVVVTAIIFGLMIDYLLPRSWFVPLSGALHTACHTETSLFATGCSLLLVALLIYTFFSNRKSHANHNHQSITAMTQKYKVDGMACAHCRATVEKAVAAIPGVESVNVDLSAGTATVEGNPESAAVLEAIRLAGFEAAPIPR